MEKKPSLELYIHIPFCAAKCLYCDFLSFPADERIREQYVEKLLDETGAMGKLYSGYEISSIFLGGGTPSLLTGTQTARIIESVYHNFCVDSQAEVTTEANPGTVDFEKLTAYRKMGINRLSLGLQSANDRELKELGRIHTYDGFLESFRYARKAGFDNINVDLMSALPGQTLDSLKQTLQEVVELMPEHISAYSLIVEEGTPFYERYGENAEKRRREKSVNNQILPLPDEDTEREMYYFTKACLAQAGYLRYEVSNYAKPGKECRHNVGYWTGTEYLGLGLGAASLIALERFICEPDLNTYLSRNICDFMAQKHHVERERLTKQEQMEEFMFLGLRLTKGISSLEFESRFDVPLMSVYGDVLERHMENGLMERNCRHGDVRFCLTEYGTDVSNEVLSYFLL